MNTTDKTYASKSQFIEIAEDMASKINTKLAGKQNVLTFDATPVQNSTNPVTSGGVYSALDQKQNRLTFDSAPTIGSSNPVTSGGVANALAGKANSADIPDVSNFITNTVDNLANYYKKTETYTSTEVNNLISAASFGGFISVITLPSTADANLKAIYLIPSASAEASNIKDEYICLEATPGDASSRSWEKIGSTAIDLSGYVTDAELSTALNNYYTKSEVTSAVANKQNALTFDSTPTQSSTNPVTSGGVFTALSGKQNTLTFDNTPTTGSTNPVTSGGVASALSGKQNTLTFDTTPTQNSTKPVTSGGVYTALAGKQATLTFDSAPTSGSNNPVTSGGIYTALQSAGGGVNTSLTPKVIGTLPNGKKIYEKTCPINETYSVWASDCYEFTSKPMPSQSSATYYVYRDTFWDSRSNFPNANQYGIYGITGYLHTEFSIAGWGSFSYWCCMANRIFQMTNANTAVKYAGPEIVSNFVGPESDYGTSYLNQLIGDIILSGASYMVGYVAITIPKGALDEIGDTYQSCPVTGYITFQYFEK